MSTEDEPMLTEGGNATRLELLCGSCMRYCHSFKKWLIWLDGRWQKDGNGGAMRLAERVVGDLYKAAWAEKNHAKRNDIALWAMNTDSRHGMSNLLAIAANRLTFSITADALDTDPYLLGARNKTIDLHDCIVQESRQKDLITKSIGARYDPDAKCPGWTEFLNMIFPGDPEMIAYIQRAFGYSLTGSIVEQVFFFCYGGGANGKSVLLMILMGLLGDYAKQADFTTFLQQKSDKIRNDLADLVGARVVIAVEPEEGSRFSMQVIKNWTGGEPITCRFLFCEPFTYHPVGKLWLSANIKPEIPEHNNAPWRRVQLIPFNVTIPEKEQDKHLTEKLLEELPGILNWALEGLKEYHRIGLQPPEAVRAATAEYRRENDSLEAFMHECCEIGIENDCKNADLFLKYKIFCSTTGKTPLSQTKFSGELKTKPGIQSKRDEHGMNWVGIELKPEWKPGVDVGLQISQNPQQEAQKT